MLTRVAVHGDEVRGEAGESEVLACRRASAACTRLRLTSNALFTSAPCASAETFARSIACVNCRQFVYPISGIRSRADQNSLPCSSVCLIPSNGDTFVQVAPEAQLSPY